MRSLRVERSEAGAVKGESRIALLLLACLILARIAVYAIFGHGLVDSDAQARYLPQLEEFSRNPHNIVTQIGPLYTIFLFTFRTLTPDFVTSTVMAQHILGVLTALLVYRFFRPMGDWLSLFVTAFVYAGWLALWLEHGILRESVTAFAVVGLVTLVHGVLTKAGTPRPFSAIAAGCAGTCVVLLRVELIVLVVALPIFFALGLIGRSDWSNRSMWRWSAMYFVPLVAVLGLIVALKPAHTARFHYGSVFDTAYYSLAYHGFMPRIFQYEQSRYPELLAEYRSTLAAHRTEIDAFTDTRDRTSRIFNLFEQVTEDYLSRHPELASKPGELTDRVFLDLARHNTFVYLQAVAINFASHLRGMAELRSARLKTGTVDRMRMYVGGQDPPKTVAAGSGGVRSVRSVVLDTAFRLYLSATWWCSNVLLALSLIAAPIVFTKWRAIPSEVVLCGCVVGLHLVVLSVVGDPAQRFRYPIDPFLYFVQAYLAVTLVKGLAFGRLRTLREASPAG